MVRSAVWATSVLAAEKVSTYHPDSPSPTLNPRVLGSMSKAPMSTTPSVSIMTPTTLQS